MGIKHFLQTVQSTLYHLVLILRYSPCGRIIINYTHYDPPSESSIAELSGVGLYTKIED